MGCSIAGIHHGCPWSPEEKEYHLEILAAFLAVQVFMKDKSDANDRQLHSSVLYLIYTIWGLP